MPKDTKELKFNFVRLVPERSLAVEELHIGFSGTGKGMSPEQHNRVVALLKKKKVENPSTTVYFHHGDGVGADAQAHDIAVSMKYVIVVHPPTDPRLRAFLPGIVLPEAPDLRRNKDIVDYSHYVIGVPSSRDSMSESDTWHTIRYAVSQQKLWHVIKPSLARTLVRSFDS